MASRLLDAVVTALRQTHTRNRGRTLRQHRARIPLRQTGGAALRQTTVPLRQRIVQRIRSASPRLLREWTTQRITLSQTTRERIGTRGGRALRLTGTRTTLRQTATGIPLRQTVRATLRQTTVALGQTTGGGATVTLRQTTGGRTAVPLRQATRTTLRQTARGRITLRQTTGSGITLGQTTVTRGETVPRTQTLLVRILCGKTIGPVALRRGATLRETTRRSRTTLRRSAIGTGLTGRQTTRGRITLWQTTRGGVTRRETTGGGVTRRQTTGGGLTTGRARVRSTRRGSTVRTRLRSASPRLLRHTAGSGTLRLTQTGLTAGGAIGARLTGRQTGRPGRSRARRGVRTASPRLRRRKSHRRIALRHRTGLTRLRRSPLPRTTRRGSRLPRCARSRRHARSTLTLEHIGGEAAPRLRRGFALAALREVRSRAVGGRGRTVHTRIPLG